MKKKINFPLKIVLTDVNLILHDEKGEVIKLKKETGAWIYDKIYIFQKCSVFEKLGILIHETVEFLLEGKLKFPHKFSHFIANIVETFFTMGLSHPHWKNS